MKKSLLALAVGATFLAPGAAMADTKVYGKFNIGLDHQIDQLAIDMKNGTSGTTAQGQWLFRDNNDSSRLGFKGNEDLGLADLKAIYQLEYGVDPFGRESGPFSERNIFVGLAGGFGTVKFGRYDTSIKDIGANVDQFNDTPGDIKLLMAGETRTNELVQYATPKFADAVQAIVTVQPGDHRTKSDSAPGTENGAANTIYGAVTYSSPILDAGIAYAKNESTAIPGATGGNAGLRADTGLTPAGVAAPTTVGLNILRATVQGKFVGFELGALYQMAKGIDQAGSLTTTATGSQAKDNSFLVSLGYSLEAFKFKGQYGQTKGSATDNKRKEEALGVDYKLSKSMYTSVNLIRFDQTYGDAALPKLKTDTLNLSLTYSF